MKTFLSIVLICVTTVASSQNEDNSNAMQQQTIQISNVNRVNNFDGFNNGPSIQNIRGNVSTPSTARPRQVRSRGNRGSRGNTLTNYNQNVQVDNVVDDNVGRDQNKNNPIQVVEQKQIIVEVPQVSLNLNLNVPEINLRRYNVKEEKVKEEKVAPKRLEDFRIKTGNNSSSGSVTLKSKKEKKSFRKKVLKPIKCWMQRTFRHNAKFHLSCECFKF